MQISHILVFFNRENSFLLLFSGFSKNKYTSQTAGKFTWNNNTSHEKVYLTSSSLRKWVNVLKPPTLNSLIAKSYILYVICHTICFFFRRFFFQTVFHRECPKIICVILLFFIVYAIKKIPLPLKYVQLIADCTT